MDDLIPELLGSLRRTPNLILRAAPGAGKTTRVPPALLEFGDVLVLEPRRLAARMAARRVAFEMGELPGQTTGYQVRFEEVSSSRTRLRFITEGILTRRLLRDPALLGVQTVVLDEFHERHLETDVAIALLRRLQLTGRPDLRLVVMSATLDSGPVQDFLGGCPVLESAGRLFPVHVRHQPYNPAPLEEQVAEAAARLISELPEGDILVFLPGAAEIRAATRACEPLARRHRLLIAPLSGDLPPAAQDRAVAPGPQRKLILSTNIAESSITIEGVRAVIDSGLARIASDSPWTGLPALQVGRVSQASLHQRAGRAGRTGPGEVIRLFTAEDFARRPHHDEPEITRRELSQMCLELEALGLQNPRELDWVTPPPEAALNAASALLERLGARGAEARELASLPVHPRLARLMREAGRRGAGNDGCRVAAMLSAGERYASPDLLRAVDAPMGSRTQSIYDQLRRFTRRANSDRSTPGALGLAVLAAFPDRVGRRAAPGGDGMIVKLSSGASATIAEDPGEFFAALDLEDRKDRPYPLVRLACAIEPDWLLELFPERTAATSSLEWNRTAERVEAVESLVYDALVIEESRHGTPDREKAGALLAEKALEAGLERFVDAEALAAFLARAAFAAEHAGLEPISTEQVDAAFRELCRNLRSFAELREAAQSFIPSLARHLDQRELDRIAPARLRLPSGRLTSVHYEQGKPPWVASRLQDFFGMHQSPRVADGRAAVVVHLLAPSGRPVQTTSDLAGFWVRLYPQVRKELQRRYPKHSWPENPG